MKTEQQIKDELEAIEHEISLLAVNAKPLRAQIGEIDAKRSKLGQRKNYLQKALADMRKKPAVSDHAVIRFLERRHNFCFEDVRKQLLTPTVISAMRLGAEGVKIEGGTLKFKGNTITTFIG